VEIWFPDRMSGPPVGWRSDVRSVAMFLHNRGAEREPALSGVEG